MILNFYNVSTLYKNFVYNLFLLVFFQFMIKAYKMAEFEICCCLIQCLAAIFIGLIAFIIYLIFTASQTPKIIRYEEEKYFKTSESVELFPSILEKASIHLSVIVPSYNEEDRLPKMMDETLEFLEAKNGKDWESGYEIIIVDDGSKDKTSEVANDYMERYGHDKVRVLKLKHNRGKGGAVRLGMLSARGRYLLLVDADGATKFSDFDKVFNALDKVNTLPSNRAIAVGSRSHLEADSIAQRSFIRTLLMKGFHLIVWLFCVRSVHDSQCGFKLLTREAARVTFYNLHVERWAFDVELLYIAEQLHIPVAEVAVNWVEVDGSKVVPVITWLQMGRDILFIWFYYFLHLWKVKEIV